CSRASREIACTRSDPVCVAFTISSRERMIWARSSRPCPSSSMPSFIAATACWLRWLISCARRLICSALRQALSASLRTSSAAARLRRRRGGCGGFRGGARGLGARADRIRDAANEGARLLDQLQLVLGALVDLGHAPVDVLGLRADVGGRLLHLVRAVGDRAA